MLGTFSSKSARHVPCPAIQVLASDLDAGETSRSRGRNDIPAPSKITSSMSGCADTIKPARHDELVAARARKRQSRRLKRYPLRCRWRRYLVTRTIFPTG